MKTKLLAPLMIILCGLYCKEVPSSKESAVKELGEKMQDKNNPLAYINTSQGMIVLELYTKLAPKTVKNFIGLAEGSVSYIHPETKKKQNKPYYNGIIFHRIIPNFMIQGGDILGNGTGGPGFTFEDEINADALGLDKIILDSQEAEPYQRELQQYVFKKLKIQSQADLDKKKKQVDKEVKKAKKLTVKEVLEMLGYKFNNNLKSVPVSKYTIAMANAGPNTNGSQFFINLADNHFLNGKHTAFGKVLKGFVVVDGIAKVETNPQTNKPKEDIIIKEVTILK